MMMLSIASFSLQEPYLKGGTVGYEDRKLRWNSEVRKEIRQASMKRRCTSTGSCDRSLEKRIANKNDESM